MKTLLITILLIISTTAMAQPVYRGTIEAGDSTGTFSLLSNWKYLTVTIKDASTGATADTIRIYRIIPYGSYKDTVPLPMINIKTNSIDTLLIVPGGSYGTWYANIMFPEYIMYVRTNTIIANKATIYLQGKESK